MRVNHPTLPGVTKEVPAEKADKFLECGWVEVKPAKAETPKRRPAKKS